MGSATCGLLKCYGANRKVCAPLGSFIKVAVISSTYDPVVRGHTLQEASPCYRTASAEMKEAWRSARPNLSSFGDMNAIVVVS